MNNDYIDPSVLAELNSRLEHRDSLEDEFRAKARATIQEECLGN